MKTNHTLLRLLTLTLLLGLITCRESREIREFSEFDEVFLPYISAYTTGTVSRDADIIVRLSEDITSNGKLDDLPVNLFSFSPSIKGEAHWINSRTIGFYPDEDLPSDKFYRVSFKLGDIMQVPEDLEVFRFEFATIKQSIEVAVRSLETPDPKKFTELEVNGIIYTADLPDTSQVRKVLTAYQEDRELPVEWFPGRTNHRFIVHNVVRNEEPSEVLLRYDGSSIDAEEEGTDTVRVPAMGEFEVFDIQVFQEEDPYVLIQFTDPLDEDQNFEGLVRIDDHTNFSFIAENNLLRVYPPNRFSGEHEIRIERGIKNSLGEKMGRLAKYTINFEELQPGVRLVGDGTIIPRSQGMTLPFEAVNLTAVDVMVYRIYEKNILQFLQVNDISNDQQINRVGKVIKRKVIELNPPAPQKNQWHRYGLELDDLILDEPGAIYKVFIGFRKSQALIECAHDSEIEGTESLEAITTADDPGSNYWRPYERTYYYYFDYDWKNRDNPCYESYYNRSRTIQTNVLSTNIGLVAKKGKNGYLQCLSTDLNTASPLAGIELEVYDYQQNLLTKGLTNNKGMAKFKIEDGDARFVVGSRGNQRSYLSLSDGDALPVSKFEVSGVEFEDGIKGYLYGERAVWRPGDSIYLTFVLQETEDPLPAGHPIKFELYNARQQLVTKSFKNKKEHNFYTFRLATSPDAPTGNWLAQVRVGGNIFSKSLKIETIKPNRLKVDIDFEQPYLADGTDNEGMLSAKWLHGAIARLLKAKVEAVLSNSNTTFDDYRQYEFDDPGRSFTSEPKVIFEGRLDDEGKATINPEFSVSEAPGILNARLKARVFEEGGDFSTFQMSIPYHPYENYMGVNLPEEDKRFNRLPAGKEFNVDLAAVDRTGQPLSNRKVEVQLYKLSWRWWWQRDNRNLSSYISRKQIIPLFEDTVEIVNGKGEWQFRFDENEGGRFYVRVKDLEGSHTTGKIFYIEWPGWYRMSSDMDGADILTFASDKDAYTVGEEITLTVPATDEGSAWVSIENGTKVVDQFRVDTKKGENKIRFDATADMAPNVYIHVMLVQPYAQTKNDLPMRLFGIVPVMVEDPATHLYPQIDMADELRPETTKNRVTISEKNGNAMNYTLAIVDEGLLDLTNFPTPDPWKHFYAKEALGVQTWDLFNDVLGAYNGRLERILSVGGDKAVKAKRPDSRANRFPPMVRFLGPFHLEKGKSASHEFSVPKYVGSVRVMVVAGNEEKAYGSIDKTVPVRSPLMVLGTLPRVLGPGEEVQLPVTVFAMHKKVSKADITISTNSLLEVTGSRTQSVSFNRPGEKTIYYTLKVREGIGKAEVKIRGTSGGEKAAYDVELNVRNPNPMSVKVVEAVLDKGETWEYNYQPLGMTGTNKSVVEVSSVPPLNLGQRLDYLIRYPYGCIEQTVSAAFPQLFVKDIMHIPDYKKREIENNINSAIHRLRQFQHPHGGLTYWPGNRNIDDWSTSYAGHFMLEAKERGYRLPYNFLDNWLKYQKKLARSWTPVTRSQMQYYEQYSYYSYLRYPYIKRSRELSQAYRLYTMALAKDPDLAAMNQLRETPDLYVAAQWKLAAAYAVAGYKKIAKDMIHNLETNIPAYDYQVFTYGSDLRDMSFILETLALLEEHDRAFKMVRVISQQLSSDRWLSTQTTANCLLAMSKYVRKYASNFTEITYDLAGQAGKVSTKSSLVEVAMEEPGESGPVSVTNNGTGKLYLRMVKHGQPVTGKEEAFSNNLDLNVRYTDLNGKTMNPATLEQGTDFVAVVTVRNPASFYYSNLALDQIFPSGWEIINSRMDEAEFFDEQDKAEYKDIRDDRVYTFFSVSPDKSKTFKLLLNASYTGRFYLPAVKCEAMYDGAINAQTSGYWVEVVKPGDIQANRK